MKLLLIDKTLLLRVNHRKWERLATLHGLKISAITAQRWIETQRSIQFEQTDISFPIRALPVVSPGYENRAFFTRGLSDAIRDANPDVILCFEEPFSVFAAQVTWIRNRVAPKTPMTFYSWYNLLPDRIGGYSYPFIYDGLLKYVLKSTSVIYCANPEAQLFYEQKRPGVSEPLFFGVDLDTFTSGIVKTDWPAARPFRIGYIGRLLEMKGIDTLVQAAAQIQPKLNIELVLLGSGPIEVSLRKLVATLGIESITQFHPSTAPENVGNFLRSFDVLVLPSRSMPYWKEQFGRVLVEAMACGVPVIGSDSGAIPNVIGDAGLIFPEGNVDALANQITSLIADGMLWSDLQTRGLRRAPQFSADVFASTLYSSLTRLIG